MLCKILVPLIIYLGKLMFKNKCEKKKNFDTIFQKSIKTINFAFFRIYIVKKYTLHLKITHVLNKGKILYQDFNFSNRWFLNIFQF